MWGSGSQLKAEIEAHWELGAPDNRDYHRTGDADCVSFYKLKGSKGALLYDIACAHERNSVCEKLAGESNINFHFQVSSTGRQGEYSAEVGLTIDPIDNDLSTAQFLFQPNSDWRH